MRPVVLMLASMLAACTGSSAPVAGVTPTPPGSASPAFSSSPAAAGSPSPGASSLNCRLPVTWAVPNGQTVTTKAGFVSFPSQTLLEDPSAPAQSVFYDRAFSKWLPVGRAGVSPDGKRYAYSEGNAFQNTGGKLHVVDVATGRDTVIYSGGTVYSVVDFAAEGIYITLAAPEGYSRGLWLENPAGGSPQLISSNIVAPAVGAGAAYGLNFNKADPSPSLGGIEGPMNEVVRIDLSTDAATTWFYLPSSNLYVLGFDRRGNAIVSAAFGPAQNDVSGRGTYEVWLVTSATVSSRLYTGAGVQLRLRLAAVDDHGVWFDAPFASASTSNVWLFTGASIQVVTTVNIGDLAVAGGCIP